MLSARRSLPLAGLLLLFTAVAGGCGGDADDAGRGAASESGAIDPFSVAVAPVKREAMAASYSTSATLRAEKSATVTARTRGVLEELLAEEGDTVEAGEVLAQLEDDEQALAVTRQEAVEEIRRREYERLAGLHDEAIISDSEVEATRREAREAKLDLDLARMNLERTRILAPFDGIVVVRHLDVGATVSDGTPLYDLADIDPLYVDVRVPERHVVRLASGQAVRLEADGLDAPVQARIERLAPVVDAATGTVKVTVAVERLVALRPGAFVQIDIETDVHEDALVVPRSALVADGRRWLVYRTREDGASVEALEVVLGYEEGERVEILETVGDGELAVGDELVVRGASALSDGAPIRILERAGVKVGASSDEAADEVASSSSSSSD